MFKYIYYFFNICFKKIKFKRHYYSLSSVDKILEHIFKKKNNGFYIDVGCHHPIMNNNTYILHKKGWKGINIDLDKKNIDLFNFSRKKDYNVHAAVSSDEKLMDLYFYHEKSPINTLEEKTANYQKAKIKKIIKIKTKTLNSIIQNSKFKDRNIDLLSIDVEGHEINVMKGFDIEKYVPRVIVVEYLDLKLKNLEIKNLNIENIINSNIYKLITSHNYRLVNWVHSDLVFVHNSFMDI